MSERPRFDDLGRLLHSECAAIRFLERHGLSENTRAVDLLEWLVRSGHEDFEEFRMSLKTEAYKRAKGYVKHT